MIELMTQTPMQNVYTPLNFTAHLVFCLIATAVYCTQYYRKKSPHYLLLALAVDGTFLTQINTDSWFIMALGVLEIVLLAAAAVFAFRASKAKKAELAQKSDDNSDDDDDHTPPEEDKRNAVEAAFDD